jgi:hypothetical protein
LIFVPEGQADSSQARSAWAAMQRGPRPGGTIEAIVSPTEIFVVETELMSSIAPPGQAGPFVPGPKGRAPKGLED